MSGVNMMGGLKGSGGFAAKAVILMAVVLAVLALSGAYALKRPDVRSMILNWELGGMKPADYTADIKRLIGDGRLDEAEHLAWYVASNPDMPGQESVRSLMDEISKKRGVGNSPLKIGLGLAAGFFSGGGGSTEELLGGLLSNVLLSNGGISKSDLPDRPDDESEEIALALEKANLGIAGRWFPGFIRTLHRSKLLSADFEAFLRENAAMSEKDGKPTADLLAAVEGTRNAIAEFGVQRTLGMFPEVQDSLGLSCILKWGKVYPDETYIIVTHGGIGLLRLLPGNAEGEAKLVSIARRGEPAIKSANSWLK
jgi:hypothetical protein